MNNRTAGIKKSISPSSICQVKKSEFLYSVPKVSLMERRGIEVAFVGRSNSGKSSLINAFANKNDLARTAKMPGRTRHAVVYEVVLSHDGNDKPLALVDLPGFGFALMSKTEAKECEELIFSYLGSRRELVLIVLLLDIRRGPDEREMDIIKIAKKRGIKLVLVLTKSDKIVLSKRKPVINKVLEVVPLTGDEIMLHSTYDHDSTEALRCLVLENI